jgi:hypothetical protein
MWSMAKPFPRIGLVLGLLLVVAVATPGRAEELSPEETLERYLTALQRQDFDNAYDLVSKAMKTDRKTGKVKSREVWAKQSQYLFDFSDAKIFDFEVGKAKIDGDTALVPNLLSSQDRFLNQLGVDEHEVYTLLKEDGAWKVDRQEEVIEAAEIAKWFPKKPAKP